MTETTQSRLPTSTERQLELLLKRVAEIQALFVLVERITPFVQDLVSFVFDVGPLLTQASRTLAESTAKMPRATRHLEDVTQATEMATTQVLDRVDGILRNLEELRNGVQGWEKARRRLRRVQKQFARLSTEGAGDEDLQQTLRELSDKLGETLESLPSPRRLRRLVDGAQEYGYEIMSALQVQDITAQQLAAARDLINRVHAKVADLLRQLGEDEPSDRKAEASRRKGFDADARFNFEASALRQEHVDQLLEALLKSRLVAVQSSDDGATLEG